MTSFQAKKILQIYRPGTIDENDPEIAEALEFARHDSELGRWLEEHDRFQTALRKKFQELPVPSDLKQSILAQPKIIRPQSGWQNAWWLRAAAAIVLLAGLGFWLFSLGNKTRIPDRFADYEFRMVRSALREYRMDLVTNDLVQVRQWMLSRGAPADFSVPKGLSQLQLTGGGILRWRNNPVTMVCFNRGDNQMLFLFVMNRSAVKDPPSVTPEFARVSKLQTARWSEGDKTYFLAGPEEINFLQKYL